MFLCLFVVLEGSGERGKPGIFSIFFHVQRNEDIQKPWLKANQKHDLSWQAHDMDLMTSNGIFTDQLRQGQQQLSRYSTSINLFPMRPNHRPNMHLARVGQLGGALYFHPYVIMHLARVGQLGGALYFHPYVITANTLSSLCLFPFS